MYIYNKTQKYMLFKSTHTCICKYVERLQECILSVCKNYWHFKDLSKTSRSEFIYEDAEFSDEARGRSQDSLKCWLK